MSDPISRECPNCKAPAGQNCDCTEEQYLNALVVERDGLRDEMTRACELVAKMHEAAMGEVCGPVIGVVEDVEQVRIERDRMRKALQLARRRFAEIRRCTRDGYTTIDTCTMGEADIDAALGESSKEEKEE